MNDMSSNLRGQSTSLAELMPDVLSLSRRDQFRLIQILAEELAGHEDKPSKPTAVIEVKIVENGDSKDERVQEAIHAVALRNAAGRLEEGPHFVGEDSLAVTDQAESQQTATSQSYPYWSPDRDSEASAKLMKLLEAEKSAS